MIEITDSMTWSDIKKDFLIRSLPNSSTHELTEVMLLKTAVLLAHHSAQRKTEGLYILYNIRPCVSFYLSPAYIEAAWG